MATPESPRPGLLRRLLLRLAALLVLLLVYASYLQPAFVVELGNRFWSCF